MANTINERVFGVLESLTGGPRRLETLGRYLNRSHITIALQAGWIRLTPSGYALTGWGRKALASSPNTLGESHA